MKTDAKELIQKAFDMARTSGKPNWKRMTTAVLKNRLLMLTKGEFRESDYGSRTMLEFVQHASDIIDIDHSLIPPVVAIKADPDIEVPTASTPEATQFVGHERIRPDLWQAIMDYTSGNKYVWDPAQGLARPQARDDSAEVLMPTISPETEMKWRKEFVATLVELVPESAKGRLSAFEERSVSPKVLPLGMQWKWNDFLKAKIVGVLTAWFQQKTLSPPDRLTVSVRRPPRPISDESVENLRALIMDTVKAMTPSELLTVSLPATAVLRSRKDRS